MATFVFLCDLTTETECLERSLFGTNAGESHREHYSRVAVGDTLFLYNLDTGQFRGPYSALTPCQHNLEPKAWAKTRRKFPWQVRVDKAGSAPVPLTADQIGRILPLASTSVGVLPPYELGDDQVLELLKALQSLNELRGSLPSAG